MADKPETMEGAFDEGTPASGFQKLIAGIEEKAQERAVEYVTQMLADAGAGLAEKPERNTEDERVEQSRPARSIRVGPVGDSRYDRLPEWQREYRSPEGDELIKRWLIAVKDNDRQELRQIAAEDNILRQHLGGIHARTLDLTTGDATVPVPMANLITALLQRLARWRSLATVQQSANTSLRWPFQSALSTATWEAESDAIDQGEPGFGEALLTKHKLATISRFTNELLADSAFDLVSFTANDVASTFAAEEDVQFSTSDGTANKPTLGFDQITITPIQPGTARTLAVQDLVNLYFAVSEPYRREAVWLGNDAVMALLTSLRDGANGTEGRQILNMHDSPLMPVGDLPPGTIGTVMGRPVVSVPLSPNGAGGMTDPGTNRLYFGSARRTYGILDGGGIQAAVSTERYFELDQVAYRWTRRMDGNGILPFVTGANVAMACLDDLDTIG